MKIIVRGILQKLLKYWTIRRRNDRPSNPAIQRIILEIDWFQGLDSEQEYEGKIEKDTVNPQSMHPWSV